MNRRLGIQCRCRWCGRWSPQFPYSWICEVWMRVHHHEKVDWLDLHKRTNPSR